MEHRRARATAAGRGDDPFVRGADMHVYDVNGDGLQDLVTLRARRCGAALTCAEEECCW